MTDTTELTPEMPTIEQKESIKLIRNSRGVNWEIRILSLDVDRLAQIDDQMKARFNDCKGVTE